MKLDSKTVPIIMFAILIAASAAFIILNVMGITADDRELAEKQNVLYQSTRHRNYLMSLAANSDMVKSKNAEFLAMLPETVGQNDILLAVHRLSGKYGVSVSQVTFDQTPAGEDVQARRLGFTLSMEGGFEDIMKMLEELTGKDKIIQVESLTLNANEGVKNVITANATIAVYHR